MINDISTWTEADLTRLISQQEEESLTLEYKRSDSLGREDREKNEMAKDVSAHANSDGGVLIYGIEEDNHRPVRIDEGVDPADVRRSGSRLHPGQLQDRRHEVVLDRLGHGHDRSRPWRAASSAAAALSPGAEATAKPATAAGAGSSRSGWGRRNCCCGGRASWSPYLPGGSR